MDIRTGFFYLFSALLLFAAFRVITARNPVHAVITRSAASSITPAKIRNRMALASMSSCRQRYFASASLFAATSFS